MPKAGQSYIVTLKQAHINWGTHRHTRTRPRRPDEGYLQIPAFVAYAFDIKNNYGGNPLYNANTSDGVLQNVTLLASGKQSKPDYAKQFQSKGDLQILGRWIKSGGTVVGDQILVEFITPTEILLTKI